MKLLSIAILLLLAGCALGGSINPAQISGTAAGLFGIPSATVNIQEAAEIDQLIMLVAKLQLLKAQLNGAPLPPIR